MNVKPYLRNKAQNTFCPGFRPSCKARKCSCLLMLSWRDSPFHLWHITSIIYSRILHTETWYCLKLSWPWTHHEYTRGFFVGQIKCLIRCAIGTRNYQINRIESKLFLHLLPEQDLLDQGFMKLENSKVSFMLFHRFEPWESQRVALLKTNTVYFISNIVCCSEWFTWVQNGMILPIHTHRNSWQDHSTY